MTRLARPRTVGERRPRPGLLVALAAATVMVTAAGCSTGAGSRPDDGVTTNIFDQGSTGALPSEGSGASGDSSASSGGSETGSTPSQGANLAPVPRAAAQPGPTAATRLLATLPVRPKSGGADYTRAAFGGGWADTNGNGCTDDQDVLRAQLEDVRLQPGTHGCVVASGVLDDPYTGQRLQYVAGPRSPVNLDHVVSLRDAWVSGASRLSRSKRVALTNDPLELLATSGAANEDKGDQDASQWLPPRSDAVCNVAERQVAVKAEYGLSVTQAEHDALLTALRSCG